MRFWSDIAEADGERYLKSFCLGTNLSTPAPGYSFADYNEPRGLETFEPCSIANFTEYGRWFQQHNVPWVEPVEVEHVDRQGDGFAIFLSDGERFVADRVVIATGVVRLCVYPARAGILATGSCGSYVQGYQLHCVRRARCRGYWGRSIRSRSGCLIVRSWRSAATSRAGKLGSLA
jgi:hypothetical protein